MSFAKTIAALEEFAEEVNSEIVTEQPTDGDFAEETAGVDFPEESGAIDEDVAQIADAAQGLEDIISLVEEAPGETDKPLEPFVEKAVNVALESNDVVQEAGNPVDGDKDKTKGQVLNKIKEFAKKVWEMLRNFGKKIAQWVRDTWAKYTDRLVKNANQAQKIIEITKNLATKADAKITDKSLLAKIATAENTKVGEVLINVHEHADLQGGKEAEKLTREAIDIVKTVASGKGISEEDMTKFVTILSEGGSKGKTASDEQRKAIGINGTDDVIVSEPFFAGYRAWMSAPKDGARLGHWKHGLSKVDEVKVAESIAAPDGNEIKAIAEYIVGLSHVVKVYRDSLKNIDALNAELDKAAKTANSVELQKTDKMYLSRMQAVIPRIIKGPQVAAYGYAASASTVALQFCTAAIAAHRGETSLGEKAGAAASAAKDKVKGAFGKKAE